MRPHIMVIWTWSSIALQMSVLSIRMRVYVLPETVISSASNTYTKKRKRLGIIGLPLGRLYVVVFTYSNILLSVSILTLVSMRVSGRPKRVTSTV